MTLNGCFMYHALSLHQLSFLLIFHQRLFLFVAKKHKEETPPEAKMGIFVFSNGDKYGMFVHL